MKNVKLEKEIMKIINKYQPILLLQKHTFKLKYPTESPHTLAECVCNYPYLNVTIRYGDKLIDKWKRKEDIVPYILHEMCHPITDPLYCKSCARYVGEREILDEREHLTDYICNIIILNKL